MSMRLIILFILCGFLFISCKEATTGQQNSVSVIKTSRSIEDAEIINAKPDVKEQVIHAIAGYPFKVSRVLYQRLPTQEEYQKYLSDLPWDLEVLNHEFYYKKINDNTREFDQYSYWKETGKFGWKRMQYSSSLQTTPSEIFNHVKISQNLNTEQLYYYVRSKFILHIIENTYKLYSVPKHISEEFKRIEEPTIEEFVYNQVGLKAKGEFKNYGVEVVLQEYPYPYFMTDPKDSTKYIHQGKILPDYNFLTWGF